MTLPSGNNRPIDASVVLGTNTNTGKDIIITNQERLRGISVVGTTGTGKSSLLTSIALQAVKNGESLVYIDVDNRSINDLLVRIPQARMNDVVLLDFSSPDRFIERNHLAEDIRKDILDNKKILLVHLSKKDLQAERVRRIGAMILEELKHALFSRPDLPNLDIVNLICDEWQLYLTPDFFEDVLSQGRRYGVATVLATQTLVNLDTRLQTFLDQVGTHITFAVGREDTIKLAPFYVKVPLDEFEEKPEKPTRTFADMEKEKAIELLHLPDGIAYVAIRMRMKIKNLDERFPRVRSL